MKRKSLVLLTVLCLALSVSLAACNNAKNDPPVPEITFSQTEYTVAEDAVVQIAYTANAAGDIAWSSADTGIALVYSGGRVRGISPGTAEITAVLGNTTARCTVTVTAAASASEYVTTDKTTYVSLVGGAPQTIAAKCYSLAEGEETEITGREFKYTSSDETVASVSESGVIQFNGSGVAEITVSCGNVSTTVTADVYTAEISNESEWLAMFGNAPETLYAKKEGDKYVFSETAGEGTTESAVVYHKANYLQAEEPTECVKVPLGKTNGTCYFDYADRNTGAILYENIRETDTSYGVLLDEYKKQKNRYLLTADLSFAGVAYTGPNFGTDTQGVTNFFSDEINGNGHTVSDITIPDAGSVFGAVYGAQIRNIAFENIVFQSPTYVGGLAYQIRGDDTLIENVSLSLRFNSSCAGNGGAVCANYYGGNLRNVFVKAEADGMSVSEANIFGAYKNAQCSYVVKSQTLENVLFYAGGDTQMQYLPSLSNGAGDVRNVLLCETEIQAAYYANMYFPASAWTLSETAFPALKVLG